MVLRFLVGACLAAAAIAPRRPASAVIIWRSCKSVTARNLLPYYNLRCKTYTRFSSIFRPSPENSIMEHSLTPAKQLNRTFIGSVLFLDIVNYSRQTVPDQLAMKEVFIDLLIDALKHVASGERIMVDTGDGAGIAFLGDPEDALFTALSLRDAIDDGKGPPLGEPGFVRMGINLGPLKVVRDVNGHTNMIGDGVNDAQRVMSFAAPGQVMVSHSYYDIVSRLSHDYTKLFVYEGTKHDKHVREHEVYRLGAAEDAANMTEKMRDRSRARHVEEPWEGAAFGGAKGSAAGGTAGQRQAPQKSRVRAGAIAACVGVAGIAFAGVWANAPSPAKPPVAAAKPAVVAPAAIEVPKAPAVAAAEPAQLVPAQPVPTQPVPTQPVPAQPAAAEKPVHVADSAPAKRNKKPADDSPAAGKPGTVVLAVHPWGEVYVDGARRGISPPMKSLSLSPGKHQIVIRNGTFAPYTQSIVVQSGANTKVSYVF